MSYFEYLKNKRIAKREMAKMMATTLPLINRTTEKNAEIAEFALDLIDACKNVKREDLINKIVEEVSSLLETTQPRLLEILTYLAAMSPEDLQRVLIHATVHTNQELKDGE